MTRFAFYEDAQCDELRPIALLRPVFDLRCGHFTQPERLARYLKVSEWGAIVRPWLAATVAEEHPAARVNDLHWLQGAATWLINARWLADWDWLQQLDPRNVAEVDGSPVAVHVTADEAAKLSLDSFADDVQRLAAGRPRENAPGALLAYPWDLVHHNATMLRRDFQRRDHERTLGEFGEQVAVLEPDAVSVDRHAQIDPFVVLDARGGPIWIEAGAKLLSFTRVEGPAFIGRGSQLFRAHVREGTTIGPQCRVGGEVEESILHGYVNKYHDGFLGHSYVCPWVNLGAMTTNSDLKNDYSHVRVPLNGVAVDSGQMKVGCFLGDHTKTAIGTLFNTGTSVGAMAMVLPAGELLPKHIPSFSRVWHGRVEDLPNGIEPGIAAARVAMSRRDVPLTSAAEKLLQRAFDLTQPERETALRRAAAREASTG